MNTRPFPCRLLSPQRLAAPLSVSFALAPETCGASSCVVDLVPEICDAPLPVPLILLQGHAMFPFRAVYLVPETCDASSFVSLTSLEAHDAFFPHREFPFPTPFPLPLRRPAATLFEYLQFRALAPSCGELPCFALRRVSHASSPCTPHGLVLDTPFWAASNKWALPMRKRLTEKS